MPSEKKQIPNPTLFKSRGKLRFGYAVFTLLLGVGIFFFIAKVTGPDAQRIWQAFLVNFHFWSGISYGAMAFVAVLNITQARWGRPFKRLSEALGAFTLVSYLLFWVLYLGRAEVFPWIKNPVHGKEAWLNPTALFLRDGIALLILTSVSLALIILSVKQDLVHVSETDQSPTNGIPQGDRFWKMQIALSPVYIVLYGFVLSLAAFDLIMSLSPHWYSTLFGGYYFIGAFYCGLAALILLSVCFQTFFADDAGSHLFRPRHLHDLGKLLFGFCLMTGYLFYTQFLVIWYGNLPEETRYLIQRLYHMPWKALAIVILAFAFAIPFVVLLRRKIKKVPAAMGLLCLLILAAMWSERFLLVVPSLWKPLDIPFGLSEVLITLGFFGAIALTVTLFLSHVPILPVSDPLFREERERIQEEIVEEQGLP